MRSNSKTESGAKTTVGGQSKDSARKWGQAADNQTNTKKTIGNKASVKEPLSIAGLGS